MVILLTRCTSAVVRSPAWLRRTVLLSVAAAVVACTAMRLGSPPSLGRLRRPDPGWLLLAVLAQAASLGAYALIVRELLRLGDVTARISTLLRATLGGIAMGASLPGGQIASTAYWYKQLRREGADRDLSAFALVVSMLAGVFSLAALLVVGVAAAGGRGPLAGDSLPILAGCASLTLLLIPLRGQAARVVGRVVRRLVPGLPDGYLRDRRAVAQIAGLAFANWLFDCACLYAALAAVHASVPLQSVLLTYTLAQLVAAVPLLPGGGGTVEASLLLGFAAFAHGSGSLIAGVLLYRVLACWGLIPVGWLAVLSETFRVGRPRALATVLGARPV